MGKWKISFILLLRFMLISFPCIKGYSVVLPERNVTSVHCIPVVECVLQSYTSWQKPHKFSWFLASKRHNKIIFTNKIFAS